MQEITSTSIFYGNKSHINQEKADTKDNNDNLSQVDFNVKKKGWRNIPKACHFSLAIFVVILMIILILRYIGFCLTILDIEIIGMMLQSKSSYTLLPTLINTQKRVGYDNITVTDANKQKTVLPYKQSTFIKFKKQEQTELSKISRPKSYRQYFFNKLFVSFMKISTQNTYSFIANIYQEDQEIDFLEYFNLNSKYNLDEKMAQLPFCIISHSRNLISNHRQSAFQILLSSIQNQNYSNYELFLIDDFSNDRSALTMQQIINEFYPRVRNRATIVENQQIIGALGNRDIISRNYCRNQSVIVDLDSNDALIGKQVFNVLNRLFQRNPQMWLIYSKLLELHYNQTEIDEYDFSSMSSNIKQGGPINRRVFKKNTYRTEIGIQNTSHLKAYLRELYIKVPLSYLFQTPKRYYVLATEKFRTYPLLELSGHQHTLFIDEVFYLDINLFSTTKLCKEEYAFMKQMDVRSKPVLLPLKNLEDHAMETPNYEVPLKIIKSKQRAKLRYLECSSELQKGEFYRD